MTKLETAISFATQVHSGQLRKNSSLPYVIHPIEVAKRLFDLGVTDEVTLIAAILHDTLEDCGKDKFDATKRYIWDTFGDDVLQVVEELTYTPDEGTKEAYIASFVEKRPESIVIKVVDRCCNILDFRTAKDLKKAVAYAQQGLPLYLTITLGIYRGTHQRLSIKYGETVLMNLTLFAKGVWESPENSPRLGV